MVKLLDMGARDKTGAPRLHILDPNEPMYKTASPNGPDISIMPDELANFWTEFEADFDRYVFAHINIVGAFEYWGSNNNGDAFRESDVYDNGYYKTFVSGHSFLLHNNKNPDLSCGKVIGVGYHPKMHRIELISALDRKNPKSTEVIMKVRSGHPPDVSMGCFLSGTMVTMADGTRKPIERIAVGDRVMTHTGDVKKVTEVHQRPYKDEIYSIRAEAHETIYCTRQHPLLTVGQDHVKKSENRWNDSSEITPEWVHAECMNDAMLLEPILTETITPEYVTRSFARFFGYYLAEGHVLRDKKHKIIGVEFSVNKEDAINNEIEALCANLGAKNAPVWHDRSHSDKAAGIYVFDRRLAELCYEHGGSYAKDKKFSESAMRWHPELQREILGAYMNGDGTGTKDGSAKLSTSSSNLAWQWMAILPRMGILASIQNLEHKAGSGFSNKATYEWAIHIGKQWAQSLSDVCSKIVQSEVQLRKNSRIIRDGYIVTPIREISSTLVCTTVYNLEVEGDESFLVAGLAVHNCKVPYDVCSVCGRKAQKRADYCDHVRDHMLDYWPLDAPKERGLIVCVFNTQPQFFDQSWVFTRADKSSNFIQELSKAASQSKKAMVFIGYSSEAAERFFKLGEEDPEKDADMEKTSPDDITKDDMGENVEVEDKEKREEEGEAGANVERLGVDICEMLADNPMHEVFDTAGMMGIHITPIEYAVIKAFKDGDREKAAFIHKRASDLCAPLQSEVRTIRLRTPRFNKRIASILTDAMETRSFLPKFDSTRKSLDSDQVKTASERGQRVSREYTEHAVSMFKSIKNWQTEFYKHAELVVMGQSDIDDYMDSKKQVAEDPNISAARLIGAYRAFMA